jgi:hypothetical protein
VFLTTETIVSMESHYHNNNGSTTIYIVHMEI